MRLRRAIGLCGALTMLIVFLFYVFSNHVPSNSILQKLKTKGFLTYDIVANELHHVSVVNEFFEARKILNLSAVGKYLFLNQPHPQNRQKLYKILIWKYGEYMEERQLYYFHDVRHDPFELCSVKNCYLNYSDSATADADAILVHLHRLQGPESLPNGTRPKNQRWIFIADESPYNTFNLGYGPWPALAGYFNWSMTYKAESDVPVAYGRTVALSDPVVFDSSLDIQSQFELLVPKANLKRRDVLVAIMMSNCGGARHQYVKDLQKYIQVDFYGGCGTVLNSLCNGYYGDDCPLLDEYLFYLAFENSNCDEYITEKAFDHAYKKGAVPVIMGSRSEVLKLMLPPNSYINVFDLKGPKDLADTLLHINATFEENYLKYHEWRKHFAVVNEHGYFNSPAYHYCRTCEALNYNDESSKIYGRDDVAKFLSPEPNNCHKTTP